MREPVRLQSEDFSLDAEITALKQASTRIGGIATFVGCARDFSEGHEVSCLRFDAYDAMALAEMRQLREQAIHRFDLIEARLVHRIATVMPGDNIVLVAVAAEHRAAAFEACRWLIDELKRQVPIWKKETTPQGDAWVSAHP